MNTDIQLNFKNSGVLSNFFLLTVGNLRSLCIKSICGVEMNSYTSHIWGYKNHIEMYPDILYKLKLNIDLDIII